MGVTVLIPSAASLALVDLATVQARMPDVDPADTATAAVLSGLIAGVSAQMESVLGRHFARQTYYEQIPGRGKPYILLSEYPIDPDSVQASIYTYSVAPYFRVHDKRIGKLFIWGSWGEAGSFAQGGGFALPGNVTYGEDLTVDVQYAAGWLLPGQVKTWAPSTPYTAGQWVAPATPGVTPLLFRCAVAGTSGLTEPTWPIPVPVQTFNIWFSLQSAFPVADGTVTWTSADAPQLPVEVSEWCFASVRDAFLRLDLPGGVTSVSTDGTVNAFDREAAAAELPLGVMKGLNRMAGGRVSS